MSSPVIYRGNPNLPLCAFTFDDGPTHYPIEAWLDALEQGGAVGTFFHTGEWIDKFPDKARAVINRGHVLVPHTYHHRKMGEVPRNVFFEQLQLVELAYQEATGLPCPAYQRFPSGNHREENLDWLAEWGYVNVEGTNSSDWTGMPSQQIIDKMEPLLVNGAILVFHSNDTATGTVGALKPLIRSVYKKGLQPVSVTEMLKSLDMPPKYRQWTLTVEVPDSIIYPQNDWTPILREEDVHRLAAETSDWHIPQFPTGFAAERVWLKHLLRPLEVDGVTEERRLFSGQFKADQYWSYVRAGVQNKDLVLLDFAVREPDGDALVYVLRWAVLAALELGCTRIVAKQELRRLHLMSRQLGLTAELTAREVQ